MELNNLDEIRKFYRLTVSDLEFDSQLLVKSMHKKVLKGTIVDA